MADGVPARGGARLIGRSVGILLAVASCSSADEPPSATVSPSTSSEGAPEPPLDEPPLSGTIVYSSEVDGNQDVFVLGLDEGDPIRVTDGPEEEFDPDLSPDGTQIAYRRNPVAGSDTADIWVMDLQGQNKRNLTNAPEHSNWAPAWTPNGHIVFSSTRGGDGILELWSMAADGSGLRRISEGWCEYAQPSPDGDEFVCAASVGGPYDIVVVDAAGGRRALTDTPVTEFGASWSPDGEWIAFSRDTGDRWELLRVRPDGTDEQIVAREGAFSTWGPDGRLAWSGPGGINVGRPDGSHVIVLDHSADFVSWGH